MKQLAVSVARTMLLIFLLTIAHQAQAATQITMVNKSKVKLNLYVDGYFACGPVLGVGQFTNSPGLSCTSGVMAGKHRLQAKDGEKVIAEDVVNIGDGTSPTWTVGAEEAKPRATAQITMVNKSQATLTLYIDGNLGCGPVGPIGRFTNSPGLFCTSSIMAGPHNLEARDGDKVVAHEGNVNIGDGSSPTWTVVVKGDPDEELIKRLDGAKYWYDLNSPELKQNQELTISGATLMLRIRVTWANRELAKAIAAGAPGLGGMRIGQWVDDAHMQINGREAHSRSQFGEFTFTISEDGNAITRKTVGLQTGRITTEVFRRVSP